MPVWIALIALGSVAVTGLLIWILWRIDASPLREREKTGD